MAEDKLWVLERGDITGPFTHSQVEAMRASGVLGEFSQVSRDKANWTRVDDYFRDLRAKAAAPPPLRPPPLPGTVTEPIAGETFPQTLGRVGEAVLLRPFPVAALVLLHFLTAGLFTFFWVTGMHGKLPRIRSDDPSAAKAIGLCLVPFYNLYWFFFVYPRLTQRLNALSRQYRLPAMIPTPLAYLMCALLLIPATMATAGAIIYFFLLFSPTPKGDLLLLFLILPNTLTVINFFIVFPIYAGMVQSSANRISDVQVGSLLQVPSVAGHA